MEPSLRDFLFALALAVKSDPIARRRRKQQCTNPHMKYKRLRTTVQLLQEENRALFQKLQTYKALTMRRVTPYTALPYVLEMKQLEKEKHTNPMKQLRVAEQTLQQAVVLLTNSCGVNTQSVVQVFDAGARGFANIWANTENAAVVAKTELICSQIINELMESDAQIPFAPDSHMQPLPKPFARQHGIVQILSSIVLQQPFHAVTMKLLLSTALDSYLVLTESTAPLKQSNTQMYNNLSFVIEALQQCIIVLATQDTTWQCMPQSLKRQLPDWEGLWSRLMAKVLQSPKDMVVLVRALWRIGAQLPRRFHQ